MAALRPTTGVHRDYDESVEALNGVPPAEDQIATGAEFTQHKAALDDHADHIDVLFNADYDFVSDFNVFIPDDSVEAFSEDDFVSYFNEQYSET